MKYKALALDLDGTLVDSNKKISAENREALWRAIDKGISIIIATGRPALGVKHIVKELELDTRGGYVLNYNGGRIVNCVTGEVMVEYILPAECIPVINELARNSGTYACTYYNDMILAESDTDEYVVREAFCNNTTVYKVEDFTEFVNYPVNKCLIVGEHEKLLPVQAKLLEIFPDKVDAFFSESYFLEIVPKGVAKSQGIRDVAKCLGITVNQIAAFGDGLNDIPMLEVAGLGVAMENAYPEAKKYADMIAPSNDNNGVAYVIDNYILK